MELGITNITLAINDIIGQLIENLPAIINQSIVIDPNRFEDLKIRYENQTKKSRESNEQISYEYKKAWEILVNASNGGEACHTIGCLSGDQISEIIDDLGNTTEWVYILYVSFVLREGSENETRTDEVVATMTNWIRENCFKLTYRGMEIKFTSLQERSVYTDKQMMEWCRDGDLITYGTGQFEIFIDTDQDNSTEGDNNTKPLINTLKGFLHGEASQDLSVRIIETGQIYPPENYVANILFQSDSIDSSLYNVSGEVTVCSNRSTLDECTGWMIEVNVSSCHWDTDGSIYYEGGIFGVHQNMGR